MSKWYMVIFWMASSIQTPNICMQLKVAYFCPSVRLSKESIFDDSFFILFKLQLFYKNLINSKSGNLVATIAIFLQQYLSVPFNIVIIYIKRLLANCMLDNHSIRYTRPQGRGHTDKKQRVCPFEERRGVGSQGRWREGDTFPCILLFDQQFFLSFSSNYKQGSMQ